MTKEASLCLVPEDSSHTHTCDRDRVGKNRMLYFWVFKEVPSDAFASLPLGKLDSFNAQRD